MDKRFSILIFIISYKALIIIYDNANFLHLMVSRIHLILIQLFNIIR